VIFSQNIQHSYLALWFVLSFYRLTLKPASEVVYFITSPQICGDLYSVSKMFLISLEIFPTWKTYHSLFSNPFVTYSLFHRSIILMLLAITTKETYLVSDERQGDA